MSIEQTREKGSKKKETTATTAFFLLSYSPLKFILAIENITLSKKLSP